MKLDRDFIHANFVRSNSNNIWENAHMNASVEAKNVSIISLKSMPKQGIVFVTVCSQGNHHVMCKLNLTWQQF